MTPIGLALTFTACADAEPALVRDRTPRVAVVAAAVPTAGPTRVLVTSLEPAQDAVLAPRLGGTVVERVVEPGADVARDAALLRLDARELRAQLDLASAGVLDARAQLAEAERRLERLAALGDAASEADVDAARTAVERLEVGVDAKLAQHSLAEVQLSHMTLRAPFDGTLALLAPERGEVVGPGTPVARVVSRDERVVRVGLLEDEVMAVDGTRFSVAGQGAVWPASLRHVAPAADPRTLTWEAELGVDADVPAGLTVEVNVVLPVPDGTVVLPVAALRGSTVAVVEDGVVVEHDVVVQAEQASTVWVTGVDAGDSVVIRGPELADGTRVVAVEQVP